MKLEEFVSKYNGKIVDWDNAYGGQCVDLYRQYCHEVLDFPQSPPVKGASDIWDTYLKDYFIRIANTPDGVPSKGDIMIWSNKTGGGFGHVGIFVEGNVGSFRSFDQNWPTGSPCQIVGHYYTNILGWLHPKDSSDYYKGIDLNNRDSVKVCVDTWKDVIDGKYVKKEEQKSCLDRVISLQDQIVALNGELKTAREHSVDQFDGWSLIIKGMEKLFKGGDNK